MAKQSYWTNMSVLALAQDDDPIALMTQKARGVILNFIESGGSGPPFDTTEIARFLGVTVVPSVEVRDARTVYVGGKPQIEFNPNRPKSRIRYSVSHELIHTLFPDWKEEIRYRSAHQEMRGDGWQLEMLCNIGASELLMPIGTFPELQEKDLSIDTLLELRSLYEVSVEALLLRFIKLTQSQSAVFSASRVPNSGRYKVDYSVSSSSFSNRIPNGLVLPSASVVGECTAIGFTSKGQERWHQALDNLKVECVGIPPYPYQTYPRVMGIVGPTKQTIKQLNRPLILRGDATNPRGAGNRILAFIVNDKTPRWGAGFALSVRKKWGAVQNEFVGWADKNPRDFVLGNIHLSAIAPEFAAALLISQHGYGDSPNPRIRYRALSQCLEKLAAVALEESASVHMPRIGSGQARGHWPIILEMIEESLSKRGVEVTIYELPHTQPKEQPQGLLNFYSQSIN